jgi:2-(1,2-epoxy-1,2-dihydrophenyl)acetyl-CoA isomerase
VSGERVTQSISDGVASIRLTRGEAGNAIDPAWVSEFGEVVAAVAAADAVRSVLISADGRAFTVGGDLKHFASRLEDLDRALAEMVPAYHAALGTLAALSVPVVAALQGPIAGGGLGLAFCADIVLITPAVRFVSGFALLGLSGDGAGSWFLPRLIGARRAAEMTLLGREVSADEAVNWGLATRIVEADALEEEAEAVARALADGPPAAFTHMKRLLRASATSTLNEQLAAESDAMIDCGSTADAVEGVRAFIERRPPKFGGGR